MAFISIIIPVYNAQEYLAGCLESVLGQTFTDWEVIVVDDGSTDDSPAICDRYAAQDQRILVIHQANARTSAARNAGVAAATGEYVTFIDNDDWWRTDDCLEKVVDSLTQSPADLLWHMSCRANVDGSEVTETEPTAISTRVAALPVNGAIRFIIDHGLTTSAVWTKVVRRGLLEEHGIAFPVGMRNEDTEWSAKVLAYCESVIWFDERFYVYRMGHPYAQTSRALAPSSVDDLERILRDNLALADTLSPGRRDALKAFLAYPMTVWAGQAAALGLLGPGADSRLALLSRLGEVTRFSKDRIPRLTARTSRVLGARMTARLLGIAFTRSRSGRNGD